MNDRHSRSETMRRKKFYMIFPVLAIAAILLLGAVVQWLWNAILPALTGVGIIGYWQSVGLLVLCRILFGGFRNSSPGSRWSHKGKWGRPSAPFRERWMRMSDEERAQWREAWRERCRKKEQGDQ